MTYESYDALVARRAQGLAPQGGALPTDKRQDMYEFPDPLTMMAPNRVAQLNKLLDAVWDHPKDTELASAVRKLTGTEPVAPATVHAAANFIRSLSNSNITASAADERAYDTLVQLTVDLKANLLGQVKNVIDDKPAQQMTSLEKVTEVGALLTQVAQFAGNPFYLKRVAELTGRESVTVFDVTRNGIQLIHDAGRES